jgi:hypothetical protein
MNPDDAQSMQDQAIAEFLRDNPETWPSFDPVENAMRRHPRLTRETAEKMVEEFGF